MRISLPEEKILVYEMEIPVRWGDMDAMGHVNNTVYFRFLESIRIEWLTHLGYPPNPSGKGPVLVNAFCNFYRQFVVGASCSLMSRKRAREPSLQKNQFTHLGCSLHMVR